VIDFSAGSKKEQGNLAVDIEDLKRLLHEILTPRLKAKGLDGHEGYLWFDQPKNNIRKVFQYIPLTGGQGTFAWGVCLDFVPAFSGEKLEFYRTDKSARPLLFAWTDTYADSFFGKPLNREIDTLNGVKEAEKSVLSLFEKHNSDIDTWFKRAESIDGLIELAQEQVFTGKSYDLHSPDPKLVLAFLMARVGREEEAKLAVGTMDIDDVQKEMLVQQLLRTPVA
jgi:hypothetical protein